MCCLLPVILCFIWKVICLRCWPFVRRILYGFSCSQLEITWPSAFFWHLLHCTRHSFAPAIVSCTSKIQPLMMLMCLVAHTTILTSTTASSTCVWVFVWSGMLDVAYRLPFASLLLCRRTTPFAVFAAASAGILTMNINMLITRYC